jgi:hypothetical protein
MAAKQLSNSLTKFSKCGALEDLGALIPLLASRTTSGFSCDVDLRVALKVGERCVLLQDGLSMPNPNLLFCISFFLHEHNYASAQAFANSFLTSEAGRKAFVIAARCMTICTDPNTELQYHALQFLSSAVWHESQVVHVLRTQAETYRIAFGAIAKWSTVLGGTARSVVLKIFHYILFGRKDGSADTGHFEDELAAALSYFVDCGGLTAFSAMFWAICTRTEHTVQPDEIMSMTGYCNTITAALMQSEFTESANEVEFQWIATEATSKTGIMAGFYALFADQGGIYRATRAPFPLAAAGFLDVLKGHGSKEIIEQAIKFPYNGCSSFPVKETWLYKCLLAARKLGMPGMMQTVMDCVPDNVKGILWAAQTLQVFVQTSEAKQVRKSENSCVFPGCGVVGTSLCPLRKCGRCLTAYYCGPAHQRAHWPMHKSDCVKPPAAATTDIVIAALAALSTSEAAPSSAAPDSAH